MATIVGTDQSAMKRVTCRNCASIIEYTEADIRLVSYRDYDGTMDTDKRLRCPACGNEFNVS
jgi:RNase P subunit RPR2